jgi:hypothetical protein
MCFAHDFVLLISLVSISIVLWKYSKALYEISQIVKMTDTFIVKFLIVYEPHVTQDESMMTNHMKPLMNIAQSAHQYSSNWLCSEPKKRIKDGIWFQSNKKSRTCIPLSEVSDDSIYFARLHTLISAAHVHNS